MTAVAAVGPTFAGLRRQWAGSRGLCWLQRGGLRMATNRLGASKPRVGMVESGRGDSGDLLPELSRVGDGERSGMAVDERDVGAWPWGNSTVRCRRKWRSGQAQLVFADLVEEARAIAEDDGDAGDGIPDHVAEATQASEATPMPSQSEWRATSSGVPMASRRWADCGDGAGVGDVELDACAGSERLGKRDGGFVQLAGMVGVGVERGHGKGTS